MIYIDHPALTKENIYPVVLQTIEDICDEYELLKEFGVISTANQQIIDYLLRTQDDFATDFSIFIDNDEVGFCFESSSPIFARLQETDEGTMLSVLSDDLEYQADFKQVSFSFRTKTHMSIQRDVLQMEEARQLQQ